MLPFAVHGISVESNHANDHDQPQTVLRNSCCCNLINLSETSSASKITPDDFQEIQQAVRSQRVHSRCGICQRSETQTGSSERTLNLMSTTASEIQNLLINGTVENFNFRVKFSNLCNLSCRSCSPSYSSRYAQSHGVTVPRALTADIGDDPATWDDIVRTIDHYVDRFGTMTLGLFGGETLMQPGATRLIDHLVRQDLCHKIDLDITTNFTLASSTLFDAMCRFRSVILKASVDSVGPNYEYVRWPATWSTILRNLDIFYSQPRYRSMRFIIQPLFNLNNIFYVADILDFWRHWQEQHPTQKFYISNVMMHAPQNMTIQNLPVIYRQNLAAIVEQALQNPLLQAKKYQSLEHYLRGVLEFCQSQKVSLDQFDLYLYETARHDRVYHTTMSMGNHKLYATLSEDHRQLYESFLQGSGPALLPGNQRHILFNNCHAISTKI